MRKRIAIVASLIVELSVTVLRGYGVGGNVVVRCRHGHVFTTIWLPGASVKSLRLGWWRLQYCPVGRHWSIVTPVARKSLTASEADAAASVKDVRLP